ncbi:MAG TPA: ATP-binding cassette domain-containing protein [Actinomycetota bacterium]
MSGAAIEIRDVEVRYGSKRAIAGVGAQVGVGVTGLLGPNGAGKTTLLRVLATVAGYDAGSIRILGFDPESGAERTEIRRKIGYMPQEPGFYQRFTAYDFVDYIAILKEMTDRGVRRGEVRRVLDAVGLGDVMGTRIRALSGGMRRRVALAQALLGSPPVLLLDEPSAGLDPELRLRFRDLISSLGEDRAVLLSTHHTEDVAALCRDVIVLHRGSILFQGSPASLAATARGRVWLSDTRPEAGAGLAWRTGDGKVRSIGARPSGAIAAEPTIEDAYLLMVGASGSEDAA